MDIFYQYKAKVISVYDGDTFTLNVDLGMKTHLIEKIRLARVNTPEVRGAEKEQGKQVRDHVKELILGKDIIIHTRKDKEGKYGRYIAEVFFQNTEEEWINLNDYLLEQELAKLY